MRELIRLAYGINDHQLAQAPQWVDSHRFDIIAKVADARLGALDTVKSQPRELLNPRFQPRTHAESKLASVYLLTRRRTAPGYSRTTTPAPGRGGRLVGRRVAADHIAKMLSRPLGREVGRSA